MTRETHHHENPAASSSLDLHIEYDLDVGIWRVWIEGDRGSKPLYAGANAALARQTFEDARAGFQAIAGV